MTSRERSYLALVDTQADGVVTESKFHLLRVYPPIARIDIEALVADKADKRHMAIMARPQEAIDASMAVLPARCLSHSRERSAPERMALRGRGGCFRGQAMVGAPAIRVHGRAVPGAVGRYDRYVS